MDADGFEIVKSKSKGKTPVMEDNIVSTRLLNTNNGFAILADPIT